MTIHQHQRHEKGVASGQSHTDFHDQRPQDRHEQIRCRACRSNYSHVAFRVVQLVECHRYGFGPAKNEATHGEQQTGHQNGADGINMLDRVQRQPPHFIRGGIAQLLGDPAMRDFVDGNGEDDGNGPDSDFLDQ